MKLKKKMFVVLFVVMCLLVSSSSVYGVSLEDGYKAYSSKYKERNENIFKNKLDTNNIVMERIASIENDINEVIKSNKSIGGIRVINPKSTLMIQAMNEEIRDLYLRYEGKEVDSSKFKDRDFVNIYYKGYYVKYKVLDVATIESVKKVEKIVVDELPKILKLSNGIVPKNINIFISPLEIEDCLGYTVNRLDDDGDYNISINMNSDDFSRKDVIDVLTHELGHVVSFKLEKDKGKEKFWNSYVESLTNESKYLFNKRYSDVSEINTSFKEEKIEWKERINEDFAEEFKVFIEREMGFRDSEKDTKYKLKINFFNYLKKNNLVKKGVFSGLVRMFEINSRNFKKQIN